MKEKFTRDQSQNSLYNYYNENWHHKWKRGWGGQMPGHFQNGLLPEWLILGISPLPTRRQSQNLVPQSLETTCLGNMKSQELTDPVCNSFIRSGHVRLLLSQQHLCLATFFFSTWIKFALFSLQLIIEIFPGLVKNMKVSWQSKFHRLCWGSATLRHGSGLVTID